ncbi:membrane dipeptidase [Aliihoeflea sp. PC F10.4]
MLIDGFQPGTYGRAAFRGLLEGGVSAVTVNCGYWEDPTESLDSLARWRDIVRESTDLAVIARSCADIEAAEAAGKVAVLLGYQNTACLAGRIRFVELFAELGIRVMQLTYNNQNDTGSSCYETRDGGLTRFGREVVPELNACRVLIDLSHVGETTALETIALSKRPVSVTHANAASLFAHRRNKSDRLLRALAENGGVIGCATYPRLVGATYNGSLEAWCTMVARTVDIAGIAHVGIGTGRRYAATSADLDWARMGRWTRRVDRGAAAPGPACLDPTPSWCTELHDLSKLEDGLRAIGFNAEETELILRDNWMRVFSQTID